jgi:hypothetical protein
MSGMREVSVTMNVPMILPLDDDVEWIDAIQRLPDLERDQRLRVIEFLDVLDEYVTMDEARYWRKQGVIIGHS